VTNPAPSTTQVVHLDFIALADHATEADIEDLIAEAATLTQLESVITAGVIRAPSSERRTEPPLSRGGAISTHDGPASPSAGIPPFAQPSDYDLAFYFVLDAFTSLEPFGTNDRYIHFLQGKVARMLRGFAGADIALQQPFPDIQPHATCLALIAPDETYDWEVRAALEAWTQETEAAAQATRAEHPLSRGGGIDTPNASASEGVISAIGLAIGERQRYRGCVLSFTTAPVTAERIANRRFTSTLIAGRAARL
jgi:hypothetical protein